MYTLKFHATAPTIPCEPITFDNAMRLALLLTDFAPQGRVHVYDGERLVVIVCRQHSAREVSL